MNASKQSRCTVLLAVSSPSSPYCAGISRFAKEHGWTLTIDSLYTGSIPTGWQGHGILVEERYHGSLAREARRMGLPCVSINCGAASDEGSRVQCDNRRIGELAAEHLMERGYKRFGWAPFSDDPQDRERAEGFESTLRNYGHAVTHLSPAYRRCGDSLSNHWMIRRETLGRELMELPKGTGIFAHNDCLATDLLQICRDHGLDVPGDIAILGVDNAAMLADLGPISLSSIDVNFEELGYQAAHLLEQVRLGQVRAPQQVLVEPKGVVTRLSTGIPVVGDLRVRTALCYISDAYMNPTLGVQDVAEFVHISRRSLERIFRHEVGMSVAEYIASTRMQEAARLLRTHDRAKVFDVAGLVGFSAQTNFFRRFRRHFGVTPKSYMRQFENAQGAREAC